MNPAGVVAPVVERDHRLGLSTALLDVFVSRLNRGMLIRMGKVRPRGEYAMGDHERGVQPST